MPVAGSLPQRVYAWRKRPPSKHDQEDRKLLERIWEIHAESRGTYGAPRIQAELCASGIRVSRKRVARLMRSAGLSGASRRWKKGITVRDPKAETAPELVERDFSAAGPDELWVADITYIPTREGFLYLAVVMDAFSRRVVGWAMGDRPVAELVLGALEVAIVNRRPKGVIHHSDHGSQYTSLAFGRRCREAGVALSMGSVGDCYDNALCESFFATLECELLQGRKFGERGEARREVFWFIEGWYNPRRRHSGLEYLSPVEFERRHRSKGLGKFERHRDVVPAVAWWQGDAVLDHQDLHVRSPPGSGRLSTKAG